MKPSIDVKNLDKDTLEFAIQTAWGFKVLCKNTKEGQIKASAYAQVESVLEHYLQQIEQI
jgi:hypothetical protein